LSILLIPFGFLPQVYVTLANFSILLSPFGCIPPV
jgi:hypothetical protein